MKNYKVFESSMKIQDLIMGLEPSSEITTQDIIDVKDDLNRYLYDGWDFLSKMIMFEMNKDLIQTAIDCGADINIKVKTNNFTVAYNFTTKKQSKISLKNATPLIIASMRGITYEVIRLLLNAGANWNDTNDLGFDFADYLYGADTWLSENYPEQYKVYKTRKTANSFNL